MSMPAICSCRSAHTAPPFGDYGPGTRTPDGKIHRKGMTIVQRGREEIGEVGAQTTGPPAACKRAFGQRPQRSWQGSAATRLGVHGVFRPAAPRGIRLATPAGHRSGSFGTAWPMAVGDDSPSG